MGAEIVEPCRAGKDLDAFAFLQPIPRFLPDDAGIAIKAILGDHRGRDPHLVHLDAGAILVFRRVPKPEEVRGPLTWSLSRCEKQKTS